MKVMRFYPVDELRVIPVLRIEELRTKKDTIYILKNAKVVFKDHINQDESYLKTDKSYCQYVLYDAGLEAEYMQLIENAKVDMAYEVLEDCDLLDKNVLKRLVNQVV